MKDSKKNFLWKISKTWKLQQFITTLKTFNVSLAIYIYFLDWEHRLKHCPSDQHVSMQSLCHEDFIEKCKLMGILNVCWNLTSKLSKAKAYFNRTFHSIVRGINPITCFKVIKNHCASRLVAPPCKTNGKKELLVVSFSSYNLL